MEPPAPAAHRVPTRPVRRRRASATGLPLDTAWLHGFSFQCQPGCGLCCFATPALTDGERDRLLQLDPGLVLESDGDWTGIAVQGDGGACGLLEGRSCRLHADRPGPCRLYPLHVHFAARVQVTLLLNCPGVAFPKLPNVVPRRPEGAIPAEGLGDEWAWLTAVLETPSALELWEAGQRELAEAVRRGGPKGSSEELDKHRTRWALDPPMPTDDEFPVPSGPSESEGIASLPLFQDPRQGTVAISWDGELADLLLLDPRGGIQERLASYPVPGRRPRLDAEAISRLRWYLGLLAQRDVIADIVRQDWMEDRRPGPLPEALGAELRRDGAMVLERAGLRAMLGGHSPEFLNAADVEAGIRAVDADLVDRKALGRSL